MAAEPARAFRVLLPADSSVPFRDRVGPLLAEAIATTDLLNYARRLWQTPHNRIRFLLELPRSRRWLEVAITAEYAAGTPVTLIEGEIAELPHRLTTREIEVLTLVAAGHSNPAIADALFTSPRTVSTQVETVRGKLGAISRTAAGVLAVQQGWLRLPMPVSSNLLGTLDIAGLMREEDPHTATGTPQGRPAAAPKRPHAIRLGLVHPQHGPAQDDGNQSRRGALLAISEVNRDGGIRGRPLEPVVVDADIYSTAGIDATFTELRAREVHAALMSYVFDEATAFQNAARLGVPVLHTMTSSRHLHAVRSDPERYRALFQCVPPESNYGPGLLRFLGELEPHVLNTRSGSPKLSIRFIETTADSGQIADDNTLDQLRNREWTVQSVDSLLLEADIVEDLAADILVDPPTVLVVSEFLPSVLATLLLKLHEAKCPSVIYTIYAPSVPEFVTEMGEAAEGVVWATVSGTYSDPFGAEFRASYLEAYGDAPGLSQAGLAYDMVHIIAAAWQRSTDPSDIAGTLDALRSTRYRGVNGSYNFASGLQSTIAYPEETNDPSLGNAQLIFQVQDGAHRCLGPDPYTETEFRWPVQIQSATHTGEAAQ
ncbi:branched-chain amino acid transport system substrate-binding protein [Leucobacter luti]|uniref:Branched-chain amino acid transport system substrate-binding protein n=1 Tax=Leucobacter luti TaxID=340320 RepID=A0A4R6RXC1_9MICO|nr:ABC transporter substrate-binding protein [Leucobacter luti]TDP91474.1 branched-chain amino acid transport system substrate-binding protein [Leucobacter luti]